MTGRAPTDDEPARAASDDGGRARRAGLASVALAISQIIGLWIAVSGALGVGRAMVALNAGGLVWSLVGLALGCYILGTPSQKRLTIGRDPTASLAAWQNQSDERETP